MPYNISVWFLRFYCGRTGCASTARATARRATRAKRAKRSCAPAVAPPTEPASAHPAVTRLGRAALRAARADSTGISKTGQK
eukprot:6748525-Prymnesium_polylepis.1